MKALDTEAFLVSFYEWLKEGMDAYCGDLGIEPIALWHIGPGVLDSLTYYPAVVLYSETYDVTPFIGTLTVEIGLAYASTDNDDMVTQGRLYHQALEGALNRSDDRPCLSVIKSQITDAATTSIFCVMTSVECAIDLGGYVHDND